MPSTIIALGEYFYQHAVLTSRSNTRNFSVSNVPNIKYKALRSVCPKLYLLGHVAGTGRRTSRFTMIDGGDGRSIDGSMLIRHHGCQLLLSARELLVLNSPLLPEHPQTTHM